ncbi:MAG: sigma factor, partial [Anaerolineaceae bacterium]
MAPGFAEAGVLDVVRSIVPTRKVRAALHGTRIFPILARRARAWPTSITRALAEMCDDYWPPLYAFARRLGRSPHDAEDLTQSFFAALIERNTLAAA